ncbi:MAG TPA: PDZ domain-containing protein [bacterium]|jgi:predicted metalloprotease with PDZ domain
MNRRTLGFVLLVTGLLALGVVLVAMAAEKDKSQTRAYIGIVPGELTSDLAQQYGVKGGAGGGVLVEGVSSSSPAQEAGLRENDVITNLNGKPVTGPQEFRNQISKMKPGDEVDLAYLRGGTEHTAKIKLAEREDVTSWMPHNMNWNFERRAEGQPWDWRQAKPGEKMAYAGLLTEDLSSGLANYFKVDKGALINEVMKGSPAEKAGLKAGDVITRLDGKTVEGESDVRRVIHDHKPGDQVDFVVMREGKEEVLKVTLGEQTSHNDTGDLFRLEHDSLGGLTLVPDQQQMDALKEKLQGLRIHIEDLGDSLQFHMKDFKIPPIHINVNEFDNEPIHHRAIHSEHGTATV